MKTRKPDTQRVVVQNLSREPSLCRCIRMRKGNG